MTYLLLILLLVFGCQKDTQTNDEYSLVGTWLRNEYNSNGEIEKMFLLGFVEDGIGFADFEDGDTWDLSRDTFTYSTNENIITFLDSSCEDVEGNYGYNLSATTLTLTLINDECDEDCNGDDDGEEDGGRAYSLSNCSTVIWTRHE